MPDRTDTRNGAFCPLSQPGVCFKRQFVSIVTCEWLWFFIFKFLLFFHRLWLYTLNTKHKYVTGDSKKKMVKLNVRKWKLYIWWGWKSQQQKLYFHLKLNFFQRLMWTCTKKENSTEKGYIWNKPYFSCSSKNAIMRWEKKRVSVFIQRILTNFAGTQTKQFYQTNK